LRKTLIGLLLAGTLTALSACNMVRGAGEDLKSAADTVDRET
jgi:predicted small secreted protein